MLLYSIHVKHNVTKRVVIFAMTSAGSTGTLGRLGVFRPPPWSRSCARRHFSFLNRLDPRSYSPTMLGCKLEKFKFQNSNWQQFAVRRFTTTSDTELHLPYVLYRRHLLRSVYTLTTVFTGTMYVPMCSTVLTVPLNNLLQIYFELVLLSRNGLGGVGGKIIIIRPKSLRNRLITSIL